MKSGLAFMSYTFATIAGLFLAGGLLVLSGGGDAKSGRD